MDGGDILENVLAWAGLIFTILVGDALLEGFGCAHRSKHQPKGSPPGEDPE